jgi:uridine kinase
MNNPELESLCDLKIYVHAELDTMYRRRNKREKEERARTQEQIDCQWDCDVKPMYLKFVKPSSQYADIIVNNDRAQILNDPLKIPQINIVLTYY